MRKWDHYGYIFVAVILGYIAYLAFFIWLCWVPAVPLESFPA